MSTSPLDFGSIEVLTFDCYGTLIDWEAGILAALREAMPNAAATDDELLEACGAEEARLEAGEWQPYRRILELGLSAVCSAHGVVPGEGQIQRFGASVERWPAFPDSADALTRLAARFGLGVLTNCDEDLFAASNDLLGNRFRWIVTAERVRSYKPAPRHFDVALEEIDVPQERILHVAQSLYHDHVPAKRAGFRTAWINRRAGREGSGATPAAVAEPDLVVATMAEFAELALAD